MEDGCGRKGISWYLTRTLVTKISFDFALASWSYAEMRRVRVSVISFASENLFFIYTALKIRFDLAWFPNQNFIMLCSPLPSLSILEFRVHQRQRKAVLVPSFRIPRRLPLSPPSTAHTGFYQREGKNQGGECPSLILPALPDTAIQPGCQWLQQ